MNWYPTKEDKERIKSALDSEGSIHGNVDWAKNLGADLSYSTLPKSNIKEEGYG